MDQPFYLKDRTGRDIATFFRLYSSYYFFIVIVMGSVAILTVFFFANDANIFNNDKLIYCLGGPAV